MKQEKSSTTAEGIALLRAIEYKRPASVRICDDPLARYLVNPISVVLSKWFIDSGLYDKIGTPGTYGFLVARDRYIDDVLIAALRDGIDQVVILGAGFDTRAYRIKGINRVRVFEVDHPATQAEKRKRIRKAIPELPGNVVFVPIDFNTQSLGDCLRQGGYDESGKTLFLWQGVTMYLTEQGIDGTLSFIAQHSGPESVVVFDYFYNETLREMRMKNTKKITQSIGERLLFGIDKGKVEQFLSGFGFVGVHDADSEELRTLYFTGKNASQMVASGVGIAIAKTPKSSRAVQ